MGEAEDTFYVADAWKKIIIDNFRSSVNREL